MTQAWDFLAPAGDPKRSFEELKASILTKYPTETPAQNGSSNTNTEQPNGVTLCEVELTGFDLLFANPQPAQDPESSQPKITEWNGLLIPDIEVTPPTPRLEPVDSNGEGNDKSKKSSAPPGTYLKAPKNARCRCKTRGTAKCKVHRRSRNKKSDKGKEKADE